MKAPLDMFETWLINKNLKDRTVESYIYYFNKFTSEVFDQENVLYAILMVLAIGIGMVIKILG